MKSDKQLNQILLNNLSPCPVAWVAPDSTDIEGLSAQELERLVIIATSRMYWLFDTPRKEFVEWIIQTLTLQSKQFQSEETVLTVEQFEYVGMPTGITDIWGNDVVLGDDVY